MHSHGILSHVLIINTCIYLYIDRVRLYKRHYKCVVEFLPLRSPFKEHKLIRNEFFSNKSARVLSEGRRRENVTAHTMRASNEIVYAPTSQPAHSLYHSFFSLNLHISIVCASVFVSQSGTYKKKCQTKTSLYCQSVFSSLLSGFNR